MKEINEAYSTIMKMRREGRDRRFVEPAGIRRLRQSLWEFRRFRLWLWKRGKFRRLRRLRRLRRFRRLRRALRFRAVLAADAGCAKLHSGGPLSGSASPARRNERAARRSGISSSGEANLGLGNRIAALNYARQAVSMDPNNFEYRSLLSRLEGSSHFYQTNGEERGFNVPSAICANPCAVCCLRSGALQLPVQWLLQPRRLLLRRALLLTAGAGGLDR